MVAPLPSQGPVADEPFDLAIIGGGIGGVICLHYARQAGLKSVLLERCGTIGGLWARLPPWQDIQVNRVDWTLGDLPISGEDQAGILGNIQAWVDRFELAPLIRLETPVTRAWHTGQGWQLQTPNTRLCARWLVAATGVHNRPVIPAPPRAASTIREVHSSQLADPGQLTDRTVLVVGGGASAFDLLDLCFEYRARRVVWVYRTVRWMAPTRKPKHLAGGLRSLARQQMLGLSADQISQSVHEDLCQRYETFGVQDIRPQEPFHFDRHQLIPGRRRMLEHFASIERHRGEIAGIEGDAVRLTDGARVPVDLILWGTGYALDLRYFDLPALAGLTRPQDLAARCGSLFRSLDAPDLFFPAPSLLETTGVTPWAYAHAARSIVSHLRGAAQLDAQPVPRKLNHFELVSFLAGRDPGSYPPDSWRAAYEGFAFAYPEDQPLPLP